MGFSTTSRLDLLKNEQRAKLVIIHKLPYPLKSEALTTVWTEISFMLGCLAVQAYSFSYNIQLRQEHE